MYVHVTYTHPYSAVCYMYTSDLHLTSEHTLKTEEQTYNQTDQSGI